ncbi:hypothetical protein [Herbidospora cretacea]|uniref:hypothetical protein n=1 Tax=Herbidospora cretacea TaxID=28444 RepID=UPI00077482EB|nr:hypothetical protein [Herbidospora cretacea]
MESGEPRDGTSETPREAINDPDTHPQVWLDRRTRATIDEARRASYASAAQACTVLQRGSRMSSEVLFAATHAQKLEAWWVLVDDQLAVNSVGTDLALRRVRARARRWITAEPASGEPGTLFDHALAHAARTAARDFLHTTGRLLVEHGKRLDHVVGEEELDDEEPPSRGRRPGSVTGDPDAQNSDPTRRT